MGVRVDPSSVDYVKIDGKLMSRSKGSMAVCSFQSIACSHTQAVDSDKEIIYTYSVKFEESEIEYGSRWDIYLNSNTRQSVHWFSLTNSLFMALFLSVGNHLGFIQVNDSYLDSGRSNYYSYAFP